MENDTFQLSEVQNAVIIGGGRGIGLGLVKTLLENLPSVQLFVSFFHREKAQGLIELKKSYPERITTFQIDPCSEVEINSMVKQVNDKIQRVDLIVSTIGFLHDKKIKPEKGLRNLNLENLLEYFKVNSISSALIAKCFGPLIDKNLPSCFVSISAKIGSISDNKSGGWHGYRASKAALNMFLKNISLDWKRERKKVVVLAIHPGTTITNLSQPFTKNTKYHLHSIEETAKNILTVCDGKSLRESGNFYSWDGAELPW